MSINVARAFTRVFARYRAYFITCIGTIARAARPLLAASPPERHVAIAHNNIDIITAVIISRHIRPVRFESRRARPPFLPLVRGEIRADIIVALRHVGCGPPLQLSSARFGSARISSVQLSSTPRHAITLSINNYPRVIAVSHNHVVISKSLHLTGIDVSC